MVSDTKAMGPLSCDGSLAEYNIQVGPVEEKSTVEPEVPAAHPGSVSGLDRTAVVAVKVIAVPVSRADADTRSALG